VEALDSLVESAAIEFADFFFFRVEVLAFLARGVVVVVLPFFGVAVEALLLEAGDGRLLVLGFLKSFASPFASPFVFTWVHGFDLMFLII
jgi:hypothetical protein